MTVSLDELMAALTRELKPEQFKDYCPNGLQVQGRAQVARLVSGVTACQALIDAAIEQNADAILVHHGYFWRGEDAVLTGLKRQRIKTLMQHDISLIAYHLPLDAHAELGNNVQLAKVLGFTPAAPLTRQNNHDMGLLAHLPESVAGEDLARLLARRLLREPLHIAGTEGPIRTVAWCTGAAQGYIEQAIAAGADAYISGEISEQTVHIAREYGIHYFAAGHHATERYGVQALGSLLAQRFGLHHQFIDIDNPV
ncbi:MAG: Nif3-like dinuclear metal center hexameric protein [Pseudohongiella sp.]|uniref:Nif3-like dinuclear metal center hexameric protein n=1 Tax=Pseudohongiella sp. TaxID=1979412 RepID=UPI0034A037C2